MDQDSFARLLNDFTLSAESGDGERFARHFTEDAVYYDYIYGAHQGRAEIAHMMEHLFHRDAGDDYRWEMFDPICNGDTGYAWSLSSFTSTVPQFAGRFVVIDGMSRFVLRGGLIAEYRRIGQWRRRHGATRCRAGAFGENSQTLVRLAQGSSGNHRLSRAFPPRKGPIEIVFGKLIPSPLSRS